MKGNPWTPREISFLRANMDSMSPQDIAKALGRSYNSVVYQRRWLRDYVIPAEHRKAEASHE